VESGVIVGVYGTIIWLLYFVQAFLEQHLNGERVEWQSCVKSIEIVLDNHLLLLVYLAITASGIAFEILLIYAFIKVTGH